MFWKRKTVKEESEKPKIKEPEGVMNMPEMVIKEAEKTKEVTIFTKAEIQQQVEGLSGPGSTVFFYLAGSPASGGPLGRGAVIVELNPNYPGTKQKKYIIYTADVEGMQPVDKKIRFFSSDKPKEIAEWIKERHYLPSKRGY